MLSAGNVRSVFKKLCWNSCRVKSCRVSCCRVVVRVVGFVLFVLCVFINRYYIVTSCRLFRATNRVDRFVLKHFCARNRVNRFVLGSCRVFVSCCGLPDIFIYIYTRIHIYIYIYIHGVLYF